MIEIIVAKIPIIIVATFLIEFETPDDNSSDKRNIQNGYINPPIKEMAILNLVSFKNFFIILILVLKNYIFIIPRFYTQINTSEL